MILLTVANLVSYVGNWLRILSIRWIQIALLGNSTPLANATWFLSALAGILPSLFASNFFSRFSNREMLIAAFSVAATGSALLGILLQLGLLNWFWVTGVSFVVSFVLSAAYPANESYKKQVAGDEQDKFTHLDNIVGGLARGSAGFFLVIAVATVGNAGLLAIDAASFLPLILFVAFYKPRYPAEEVGDSKIEGIGRGLEVVLSNRHLKYLLLLNFLTMGIGNLFGYVPEIFLKRFGSSSIDYGIWLGFTGMAALAGALIGERINKWHQLTFGGIVSFRVVGAVFGIVSGMSESWWDFTGTYLCYTMMAAISFPSIDAPFRKYKDVKSVAWVRMLVIGPLSNLAVVLFSWAGGRFGFEPQQIMCGSAWVYLLALSAVYLAYRRVLR